jgi:hypothetical protein
VQRSKYSPRSFFQNQGSTGAVGHLRLHCTSEYSTAGQSSRDALRPSIESPPIAKDYKVRQNEEHCVDKQCPNHTKTVPPETLLLLSFLIVVHVLAETEILRTLSSKIVYSFFSFLNSIPRTDLSNVTLVRTQIEIPHGRYPSLSLLLMQE